MAQKKQSFVYGALILMLSNIVVKAAGALFKIPLSNLIGDTAMGFFSSAHSIYSMCFLISTAGLPVAISRMVAEARAKNNPKEVDRIYRVSLLLFLLVGTAATSLLFFGSDLIAEQLVQEPALSICIKTISPVMFFICLVSCIRGYFQGNQNMIPTAASQVIESLGKLILGLIAGYLAIRAGYSAAVVAAFALSGVTLSVVASSLFLSFAKWMADRDREPIPPDAICASGRSLAKRLIAIAIPITIASSVLSLTSVIDSILAKRALDACVGITYFPLEGQSSVSMAIYGAYTAKAVTLFNLPPTIIYPFAISIIPAISQARAAGDLSSMTKSMDFTFRIVSAICLPAAVGLGVLSRPILDLLFSSDALYRAADGTVIFSNAVAAPMLTLLAGAIVFSGLISVSGAMLQANGFEKKSILSTCTGVLVKAVTVILLVRIPAVGHYGIPLSTLLCYLTMFLFNLYFLSKHVRYRISFRSILLRPLLAAVLCGVAAILSHLALSQFLSQTLATLGGIAIAVVVYLIALFRTGGFTEEDVMMLPRGRGILILLRKTHLLKKKG